MRGKVGKLGRCSPSAAVELLILLMKSFFLCQNFLKKYQYMSSTRSGNYMNSALKKFQQFTGLHVTGILDKPTIEQMKKPRCGMPDFRGHVKRFVANSKWSKTHLTYFVRKYGADLKRSTQDKIFAKALKLWSDVSGLSFSKARNGLSADIKIR